MFDPVVETLTYKRFQNPGFDPTWERKIFLPRGEKNKNNILINGQSCHDQKPVKEILKNTNDKEVSVKSVFFNYH